MFHFFFRFLMADKPDQNSDSADGINPRMKYTNFVFYVKKNFISNLFLVFY